jgi:nickel-type superoxide dismutase maturation protease
MRGPVTPGRPPGGRPCALVAKAVLGAAVVGGAVAYVIVRPRRVEVEGRSMEPTLAPGDRLLVTRASHLQPGDVVAARDPRDHRRIVVKRVGALLGDEVVLRGDNPWASTDSRSFGTVPRRAVLGRVMRRYAPGWRAGPVR